MKRNIYLSAILIMICSINISYAEWDQACLDSCFRTGHECNYCNYICWHEDTYTIQPNYDGDTVCPFDDLHNYGTTD